MSKVNLRSKNLIRKFKNTEMNEERSKGFISWSIISKYIEYMGGFGIVSLYLISFLLNSPCFLADYISLY